MALSPSEELHRPLSDYLLLLGQNIACPRPYPALRVSLVIRGKGGPRTEAPRG